MVVAPLMRIFDIPAHLPFLDCLAAGVLREMEAEGPEALARATILLPTRRSARALREAFLRAANGKALLLPRMRALAGLSTEDADELALPVLLDLPPAVDPLRRQAVLTGFVMRLPPRHGGPATAEQAWALAGELATLLDEIALEEKSAELLANATAHEFSEAWLHRLERLVPQEHAQHWQITLTFLRGVVQSWCDWLEARGLLDVGVRRVLALRAQNAAWQAQPPGDPVIAAGIGVGGTIPVAAELLATVAGLPRGAVVLHGTDRRTMGEIWDAIQNAPSHPFCSQARLLVAMAAEQDRIRPWIGCQDFTPARAVPSVRPGLLGMALRPAEGLEAWTHCEPERWRPGLEGLSLLTAPDASHEASAIALLLREALENPHARAALVTPDRDLARRVCAELTRHGITADDSGGEPLGETPAGAFLRLIARMVAEGFSPVPLLAVLKHPLCAGGMERAEWLSAARLLERRVLRGPRPPAGLSGLREAAADGIRDAEQLARATALLDALEAALDGFIALPDTGPARPAADLLDRHLTAAEALASTKEAPGGIRLYAGEEGEVLAAHLAALAPAMAELPPVSPAAWPALFDSAMSGVVARSVRGSRGRPGGPHPRVEVLGLLEARLLSFDRVVLGALDENVWPLATDPGPWMSRPMRAEFGLPEPEARIGRVCADFLLTACAAPEAVLSRAAKRGGAPTVPARWLTRIETFLEGQDGLALQRSPAASWAAALDQPEGGIGRPCPRPAPKPPRAARPDSISVTEVATLLADPYAFYAKRVLNLRALDPLEADVGASEYGQLVHGALARFIRRLSAAPNGWPGEAAARVAWDAAAEEALRAAGPRPALRAFWRPRLARIGEFAVAIEAEARAKGGIRRSWTEATGQLALERPAGTVTLRARADRLDQLANGHLAILDYKTGSLPAADDLCDGTAPQLPLEAAMAHAGAFQDIPAGHVDSLTYWRVSGGQQAGEAKPMLESAQEIEALAEESLERLGRLVDRFLLGDAEFRARPHPGRESRNTDYDHLARVAEWAGAEEAAEEGA
jgi:ATP-dependent helicase/nuclease subunit B